MARVRTRLERVDRVQQIVHRTRERREVEHAVDLAVLSGLRNVRSLELEAWLVPQTLEITLVAGQEIVDAEDAMAIGYESVAEMRAKKAGCSGNEQSHLQPRDVEVTPERMARTPSRRFGRFVPLTRSSRPSRCGCR